MYVIVLAASSFTGAQMNDHIPANADDLIAAIAELVRKYQQAGEVRAPAPDAPPPLRHYDGPAPWEGLTGLGPTTNMQPTAELGAKMLWLSKNMPGGISMRQLVVDATEKYVNELLALHYKP
jgi:hypothetical protein